MKVMNDLIMTSEEEEIFTCLAALLCEQFCRFANVGAKISIKSYFMRSFFFLSVCSSSEVLAKITSIRSKLPPAACWYREKKKRGNCEANLLYVESDFGITDTTDKSFTALVVRPLSVNLDPRVKISAR